MIDQKDIKKITGALKDILDAELRAGNWVKETWHDWPSPGTVAVALSRPFLTPIKKDIPGIVFKRQNDLHYWKAHYFDTDKRIYLVF